MSLELTLYISGHGLEKDEKLPKSSIESCIVYEQGCKFLVNLVDKKTNIDDYYDAFLTNKQIINTCVDGDYTMKIVCDDEVSNTIETFINELPDKLITQPEIYNAVNELPEEEAEQRQRVVFEKLLREA